MLYSSPTDSIDTMDRNSAFLNNAQDVTFPKLNSAAGIAIDNMTGFSANLNELSPAEESAQYVNDADILEHITEADILSVFSHFDVLGMDSAPSDSSTATSPSISPRSDSSEEVQSERKMVYWNNVMSNVSDSVFTGLVPPPTSINPDIYSFASDSNIIDNTPESYLNLGGIKVEPLDDIESIKVEPLDDTATRMVCWTDYINDIPSTDPIISSSFPPFPSNSVMAQPNNGLVSASSMDTGFCALPTNSDIINYTPECFLNKICVKQEHMDVDPMEDVPAHVNFPCMCDPNKSCDCLRTVEQCVEKEDVWDNKLYPGMCEEFQMSDVNNKYDKIYQDPFINPEFKDIPFVGSSNMSEPSNYDLNIPYSRSVTLHSYSGEEEYSSSFDSIEEINVVNASDVCPMQILDRNKEVEPHAPSYVLNSSFGYSGELRPIDKVRNDHCYTKAEIFDEPAAKNYNYFLDDVNKIPIPVKRRPGRPRKTTNITSPKQARVIFKRPERPPLKKQKKPPVRPVKRMRLQLGTALDHQKRILHNQAERERRTALRDSMFSVAHKCPDNVLNLTEVALASTKAKRFEEVENNFTVEVLRKTEDLMKRLKYDRRLLKSKKSPTYSKMVMLLGITFYVNRLKKEIEYKEKYLNQNDTVIRNHPSKEYRRFKKTYY